MVDVPKEISLVWHVAGIHILAQVWNAIIAERLSVRHIIVQARQALVGS